MGWFSSKKETPAPAEPVRRREVIRGIQADMDLERAIDRDVDDSEFRKVRERYDRDTRDLTQAEIRRVGEARQRHGYGA